MIWSDTHISQKIKSKLHIYICHTYNHGFTNDSEITGIVWLLYTKIHAWYEYDLSQCELSVFKRLMHE